MNWSKYLVRDVIYRGKGFGRPLRGVLYRARDGSYFVEAEDGHIYTSMGWEDVAGEQKSNYCWA